MGPMSVEQLMIRGRQDCDRRLSGSPASEIKFKLLAFLLLQWPLVRPDHNDY